MQRVIHIDIHWPVLLEEGWDFTAGEYAELSSESRRD
jgi:hypothetical protein